MWGMMTLEICSFDINFAPNPYCAMALFDDHSGRDREAR